jgi:hypothetical protein
MELDYTEDGKVKIGMIGYVENMLSDFPIKFKKTDKAALPAGNSFTGDKSRPNGKPIWSISNLVNSVEMCRTRYYPFGQF